MPFCSIQWIIAVVVGGNATVVPIDDVVRSVVPVVAPVVGCIRGM